MMSWDDVIALYGADASDWLARWDRGEIVHTIEMGGLSPGYEQCIQITCAEILRWFLDHKPDAAKCHDKETRQSVLKDLEAAIHKIEVVKRLGLSGAQWSLAVNLAANIYERGPIAVMTDPRIADRRIQACRDFPGAQP
jgi:hypothetical protein